MADQQVRITIQAVDSASASIKDVQNALQGLAKSAGQLQGNFQSAFAGTAGTVKDVQDALQSLSKTATQVQNSIKTALASSGGGSAVSGLNQVQQQMHAVETAAAQTGQRMKEAFTTGRSPGLDQINQQLHGLQATIEQTGGMMRQAFSTAMGIGLFTAGLVGLSAGFTTVKESAIDFNASMELTMAGMTQLVGSADKARVFLEQLYQFAATTPFEYQPLVQAAQQLIGVGVKAQQVIPMLTAVGNAVAAVGGSSFEIQRVTLALTQMIAKGKVSAEEMMQLTEARIPAWNILAEAMGKSNAEVMKMAQNGQIAASTFVEALEKVSNARWGDMMEKQSHTFTGAVSTIKDSLNMFISTAFKPAFDAVSAFAQHLADAMQRPEFRQFAMDIAVYVQVIIDGLGILAQAFARAMTDIATIVVSGAAIILKALLLLSPFTRHSPSLIEQVQTGLDIIANLYNQLASRVEPGLKAAGAAVKNFADVTAGAMKDIEEKHDQEVRKALALWGQEAVAAYDAAKAALAPLQHELEEVGKAIKEQERALRDAEQALKPLQKAYDDARTALARYEENLSSAKQKMDEFANTPLQGEKAFTDAIFAQDMAIKQIQLSLVEAHLAMNGAIRGAQAAVQALQDQLSAAQEHLSQLQDEFNKAQQDLDHYLHAPLVGTKAFAESLFQSDMAAKALQLHLLDLKSATDDALYPMSQAMKAARDKVDEVSNALNRAREDLRKFTQAPLEGTKAFSDAAFQNEQAIKAIQLRMNQLKLEQAQNGATTLSTVVDPSGGGVQLKLFQERQDEMAKLQKQLDELQLKGENINLSESLQLDPLRRQLEQVGDTTKEISFEDAINGATEARKKVDDLSTQQDAAQKALDKATDAYNAQKDALKAQSDLMDQLQHQLDKINQQAERTRLVESLQLDPLRHQLELLADDTKEITFEEARNGITDAKNRMAALTPQIELAKQHVKDLEGALKGAQKALQALQNSFSDLEAQLEEAELKRQKLELESAIKFDPMHKALKDAADLTKEMSFEDALKGVKQYREEVDKATKQVADQKVVVQQLGDQYDAAKAKVDQQRDALDGLKQKYQDILEQVNEWQQQMDKIVQAAQQALSAANAAKGAGGAGAGGLGKGLGVGLPEGGLGGLPDVGLSQNDMDALNKMLEDQKQKVADLEKTLNFDGLKKSLDDLLAPLDALAKRLDELAGQKDPMHDFMDALNQDMIAMKLGWIELNQAFKDGGWAGVGARLGLAPLGEQLDKIFGASTRDMIKAFQAAVQEFSNRAGPAMHDITSAFQFFLDETKPIWAFMGAVVAGVVGAILGALGGLAYGIGVALGGVVQVLGGMVQIIVGIVTLMIESFKNVIHIFKGEPIDTSGLMKGLEMLKEGALNILNGLASIILGLFVGLVAGVVGLVQGFVQSFVGFFQWLYDVLVGHSIIPDLVNAIITWITTLKDKALEFISGLVTGAVTTFTTLKDTAIALILALKDKVLEYAGNLKDFFIQKVTDLRDALVGDGGLIPTLKDMFQQKITDLKDALIGPGGIIPTLYTEFTAKITDLKDAVVGDQGIITKLKSLFQQKITDLKEELVGPNGVLPNLRSKAEDAMTTMKDNIIGTGGIIPSLYDAFTQKITDLKDALVGENGILPGLKTEFETKISDMKTNVETKITEFKNNVSETFTTFETNVKTAIGNVWQKGIDFKGWLDTVTIPNPFDFLNEFFKTLKITVGDFWDKLIGLVNWLGNIRVPNPFANLNVPNFSFPGSGGGGKGFAGGNGNANPKVPGKFASSQSNLTGAAAALPGATYVTVNVNVAQVDSEQRVQRLARQIAEEIARRNRG